MTKWITGSLISALFLFASAGDLSAAVVQCPSSTDLGTLTSFNSLANACTSQDKLFWNFSYSGLGPNAPAASAVMANLISQALGGGLDIHGWNFGALWTQSGASLANFALSFTIQVCPSSSSRISGLRNHKTSDALTFS
jgi:hypothetical protein